MAGSHRKLLHLSSLSYEPRPPPVPTTAAPASLDPSANGPLSKASIIGCSAIGLGAVFLVMLMVYAYYRRLKNGRTNPYDLTGIRLQKFSYRELKAATGSFSATMRLGKGGFGVVYKGVLRNRKEVAVKKLDTSSFQEEREFQNELLIVGRLRSPFIVRLMGYCVEGRRRLLVFEYMQKGSLQEALFEKHEVLDWQKRFKIILDVAQALEFLHLHCHPPVIHGDVKPSNVLLGPDFSARLADFGLAHIKGEGDGMELQSRQKSITVQNKCHGENSTSKRIDDGEIGFQSGEIGASGKLGVMFEVEDWYDRTCASADDVRTPSDSCRRRSWSCMSSELRPKDYVMDWIGLHSETECQFNVNKKKKQKKKKKKKNKMKRSTLSDKCCGDASGEIVSCSREAVSKLGKKKTEECPREWWKEEYFVEMSGNGSGRKQARKKGCPKSFDEQLEILRGFQGMNKRLCRDREEGSLSCRSMRETDTWSGDLMSRDMSSTTSTRGTVCYVPPEYRGCGLASEKGDIYSFGVLILVIVSGRRPLQVQNSPMKSFEKANLVSWAKQLAQTGNMLQLVSNSLCGNFDRQEAELCITLALVCLQRNPDLRPSVSDIIQILKGETEAPSLPSEFSPSPPSRKSKKKNIA